MRCRSARRCSRRVPRNIIVLPVLFEGQVKAVIELASLTDVHRPADRLPRAAHRQHRHRAQQIEATMQTEGLLKQSQQLAAELQTQQRELQQTNEQLEQKAQQLAERNVEVERKNQEIEQARRALEEKAAELALTSKYKSEFLANMSHELRTPLNSILILGQQLADNPDGNLTPKQVEFARTIHGAGTDLLNLISDILDLSKIESGTVTVDAEEIFFTNLRRRDGAAVPPRGGDPAARRSTSRSTPHLGRSIITDSKRLQQVLKNLLSNAFKFTEQGGVRLNVIGRGRRLERRTIRCSARRRRSSPSRSPTPASASRRRSRRSSSRRSSRPTPAPAANTAAPASASRSAASCRTCSAAKSSCAARPARQHLHALPAAQVRRAGDRRRSGAQRQRRSRSSRRRRLAAADRARARRSSRSPDDRLEIEPGDTHPADRRGRSALRARSSSTSRATRASRCWWRCAAPTRSTSPSSTSRPPSRSTCSCPTCWAGPCSASSSRIRRRATSRCRSSRSTRTASTASRAAPSPSSPSRPRREGLEAALARIKEYAKPRRKRLLVVEDNPAEQLEHHRAARPRRHRDRRRPAPAPRRSTPCASSRATASCSTCGCPT